MGAVVLRESPWARWVGLPFQDGGRGPAAFDCWGLVREVSRTEFGRELPSLEEYDDTQDLARLAEIAASQRGRFDQVDVGEVLAGDLVLFRIRGHASHVGLVLVPEARAFLHTMAASRSVIERWDGRAWFARIEGFYRWTQ